MNTVKCSACHGNFTKEQLDKTLTLAKTNLFRVTSPFLECLYCETVNDYSNELLKRANAINLAILNAETSPQTKIIKERGVDLTHAKIGGNVITGSVIIN